MKFLEMTKFAEMGLTRLNNGAFLTTKNEEKVNTMVVSWGMVGQMWGKPVLMAMIRKSRYTHETLKDSKEFTLTLPSQVKKDAIALCGSKSGRDMDKIAESGLTLKKSKFTDVPVIDGNALQFECKILFQTDMKKEDMTDEMYEGFYKDEDYHTLYFAEILDSYETN